MGLAAGGGSTLATVPVAFSPEIVNVSPLIVIVWPAGPDGPAAPAGPPGPWGPTGPGAPGWPAEFHVTDSSVAGAPGALVQLWPWLGSMICTFGPVVTGAPPLGDVVAHAWITPPESGTDATATAARAPAAPAAISATARVGFPSQFPICTARRIVRNDCNKVNRSRRALPRLLSRPSRHGSAAAVSDHAGLEGEASVSC